MGAIVRMNERSWAIDLITKINSIAEKNDLVIKKAGGENTISNNRGNTMFPDVVLYGNKDQSIILQGWELKMPDVSIEDETFIKDAQRKAIALNLHADTRQPPDNLVSCKVPCKGASSSQITWRVRFPYGAVRRS